MKNTAVNTEQRKFQDLVIPTPGVSADVFEGVHISGKIASVNQDGSANFSGQDKVRRS